MNRLLHIDASPRGARSRSRMISEHLLAQLRANLPDLEVETLNLFTTDLPRFDGEAVEGRYGLLMGEPVPPEQAVAWDRMRAVAEHALAFDSWLLSVPMWNFGLPYLLKQWIDVITHPGITFRNDSEGNVEGLAKGRQVIIVAASAMPFGNMAELDVLDFQLPYLRAWLNFIGITDVHALRVAGTFGPAEVVEAAMAQARMEADQLAAQLRPSRV